MIIQYRLTHCVERMLHRQTVVLGKGFKDGLPDTCPQLFSRRFRIRVPPICFDRCAEYAVIGFGRKCVIVFEEAGEARPSRLYHRQILESRLNRCFVARHPDRSRALLTAALCE